MTVFYSLTRILKFVMYKYTMNNYITLNLYLYNTCAQQTFFRWADINLI